VKKLALLSVAAGLVLFFWGFVSHVALSWQDRTWHKFTDELVVSQVLSDNSPERGLYYLPYSDSDYGSDHLRAFVNVLPPGTALNPGRQVAAGLSIHIFSALLVLGFLVQRRQASFRGTVGIFAGTGLIIGFVSHAYYWNWFGFPTSYVIVTVIDIVIGWTLAGVVVAMLAQSRGEAQA